MKYSGTLILLLSLFVVMSAQAQEAIGLSNQYEDDVFSLNYPDNWEILEEDSIDGESIVFSVSAGEDGQSSGLQSSITSSYTGAEGHIVLSIVENDGDETLEWAESRADEFDDRRHDPGLVLEFKLNGLKGAYADILGETPQRFFALRLDDEILVDVVITAETDDILALSPMLYEVLNTLRINNDDSEIDDLEFSYTLSGTHERRRDWVFGYPDSWSTEEYDYFTLLVVPNMETTLGVSFNNYPAGTETLDEYVDYLNELFFENNGDTDYENFPYELEGIPVVLTRYELEGDTGYSSLSASLRNNRVTTVSIFGPKEEIEYFVAVAGAIILMIDDD